MISILEKLINPISLNEFFNSYFEKKHLFVERNDESYFDYLLNRDDIDAYISNQDIEYPSLRLVQDGKEIEGSKYLIDIPYGSSSFANTVDTDKLLSLFDSGATIVLQALHRSNKKLESLCLGLSKEVPFQFQTNIYITPKTSAGFTAHYDAHDVFVIQVSGKKNWKIYNSPINLPTKFQGFQSMESQFEDFEEEQSMVMKQGDLLYIPRGVVHSATSADEISVHITLGMYSQTYHSLFKYIFKDIFEIEDLRQSLPLVKGYNEYDFGQIQDIIQEKLNTVLSTDYIPNRIELFENEYKVRNKISHLNRISDRFKLSGINGKSKLFKRKNIHFKYFLKNGRSIISLSNKNISFPEITHNCLEYIMNNDVIILKEIPKDLDDKGVLVLIKKLILEGFLTLEHEK